MARSPRTPIRLALAAGLLAACGAEAGRAPEAASGPPQRIVPTNAAATDLVLALVEPDRVVAVPEQCETWSNAGEALARVEGRFPHYRTEALLGLEPDLVVTHAWQDVDTTEALRRAGARVAVLSEVTAFEDLLRDVERLGEALGEPTRAEGIVADLRERREALRASRPERRPRALVYTNYGSGGWTSGPGSTADLLFDLAGLANAATELQANDHFQIDFEAILTLDPDLFVVGADDEGWSATGALLANEPALAGLGAIRAGRIVEISTRRLDTASHHLLRAAEELASAVRALELDG